MRFSGKMVLSFLLVCFFALPLLAQTKPLFTPPPPEYSWLVSPQEAHGDEDGYFLNLVSQLLQNPEAPYMPLVVERLREISPSSKVYPLVESTVNLLLQRNIQNGHTLQALQALHRLLLAVKGTDLPPISPAQQGYVENWQILGPFGHSTRSLFYRVFQPELDQQDKELDFKKTYEGNPKEVGWKTAKAEYGNLSFYDKIKPAQGCVYAVAQVFSPARQPVVLRIRAASFKAWINGNLFISVDRFIQYMTNQIRVTLYLEKGWNRFFFKLPPSQYGGLGSLVLQIVDPRGLPLVLASEKTGKFHPLESKTLEYYSGPRALDPQEYYVALNHQSPSLYAMAALGHLAIKAGLEPQGLDLLEKAKNLEPQNPYLLHIWAGALEQVSFLPDHMRRNQVKQIYETIQKEDPLFVRAYLALSRYYHDNDKAIEALDLLEKALEKVSNKLLIYYQMSQICFRERWDPQAIQYIRACEKIKPDWEVLYQFWLRYYQEKNNLEKVRFYEKLLSKEGETIQYEQGKYHLYRGEMDKAYQIFSDLHKKNPGQRTYLQELYNFYYWKKDFGKAIELYKKISEHQAEKADVYEQLGNLYQEWGKKDEAIKWYEKALQEKAGKHTLRYYLAYLLGKEGDYAKEYELDLSKYIQKSPGSKEYPKAHSVVVLDQTVLRIYEDGSMSQTVHSANKILDEEGKERYHTAYFSGDVYELRTFDKQRKIWEPIIPQQGNIVPPALGPEAVLEKKYRSESEWGSNPFEFRWGPFFFKDNNYDEPVVISQLVLILSKKYPVKIIEKNGAPKPKIIEKEKDTIYIWTLENQDRTEIERFMPGPQELLPYVMMYNKQPLEEHIWKLSDRYAADVRVTPQIEKETEKALSGHQGKSQYEQAKILYEYVHKLIPQGNGSGEAGSALSVLLNKEGDRGVLYTAMLKVAGIEYQRAYIKPTPNPVHPEDQEQSENLVYGTAFMLKVLPKDHAPLWVTSAIRNLPFGKIPEMLQGGQAFVFQQGSFSTEELPKESEESKTSRFELELRVMENGDLQGSLTLTMPGTEGDRIKEFVKTRPQHWRKNVVEGMTNRMFPGATVDRFEFLAVEDNTKPFQLKSYFQVLDYLRKRGEEYDLKPGLPALNLSLQFAGKDKRIHDFIFPQSSSLLVSAKVQLDKRWALKEVPSNLILETKMGSYYYTHSWKNNVLSIQKSFNLTPFRLKAEEYSKLLEWCRQIDSRERINLVLKEK